MCIINNAPACEVSQIATSTWLSLTEVFAQTQFPHIFLLPHHGLVFRKQSWGPPHTTLPD